MLEPGAVALPGFRSLTVPAKPCRAQEYWFTGGTTFPNIQNEQAHLRPLPRGTVSYGRSSVRKGAAGSPEALKRLQPDGLSAQA